MASDSGTIENRLTSRMNAFLLLRRLFEKELDGETADAIRVGSAADVLLSVSDSPEVKTVVSQLSDFLSDATLDSMKTEYTKMFIGPTRPRAPYWESVYLDPRELLFLESTSEVRATYRSEGLEIKGEHGREAEDALPFELDFLAYLTRHAIEAFGKDDIDEYTRLLDVQARFETEHMLDWLPKFAERAAKVEDATFYPNLCAATERLIQDDLNLLRNLKQG